MMETDRLVNTEAAPLMPETSLRRFESGSSVQDDKIPSSHQPPRRSNSFLDDGDVDDEWEEDMDNTHASFEVGFDPIERNWGDSRDYSRRGTDKLPNVPTPAINLRDSQKHNYDKNKSPQRMYPRRQYSDKSASDDSAYSGRRRQREPEKRSQHTLRLPKRTKSNDTFETKTTAAMSSCCSQGLLAGDSLRSVFTATITTSTTKTSVQDSQPIQLPCSTTKVQDISEPAMASRPSFHSTTNISNNRTSPSPAAVKTQTQYRGAPAPPRFRKHASTGSAYSTGSAGSYSRSAPMRRAPIPREPSVYRPGDSRTSRDFSYKRHESVRSLGSQGSNNPSRTMLSSVPSSVDPVRATKGEMVHIAPGVSEPLRGADETYAAVRNDFYENVSCFGCSKELCCIADVSYILCPECKIISPVEGSSFEGKAVQRHGLGLGFTYETLFQMQTDIIRGRKETRKS